MSKKIYCKICGAGSYINKRGKIALLCKHGADGLERKNKDNIIKGKIEGKKVLVIGNNIWTVKKEYENGEVLYTNGYLGRVEDIIKEVI